MEQRSVSPHVAKFSATDVATVFVGFRALSHVELIDPDQRDVVTANRFHFTVGHCLSPLNTVRLNRCAVKMKCDDVTCFVDDRLSTLGFGSTFPDQWADSDDSTSRIQNVSSISEPTNESLVPTNSNHVRQVIDFVAIKGEVDPFVDLQS